MERCKERKLIGLLDGCGAVGKGRETQRGPQKSQQIAVLLLGD